MSDQTRSAFEATTARLRAMALAREDGAFLGSEDDLVGALGVSRVTVRQVARLLESEGTLRVRRGINGGYFAARPTLATVEAAVSAYLDTLDMDAEDTTVVASVLWVEAVRKAAAVGAPAALETAERLRKRLTALKPDAPFAQLTDLDKLIRTEIFALTRARYIELIFQINTAFARQRFSAITPCDDPEDHRRFVAAWRKSKLMELDAVSEGDQDLAALAARRSRHLWHQRIWASGETAAEA